MDLNIIPKSDRKNLILRFFYLEFHCIVFRFYTDRDANQINFYYTSGQTHFFSIMQRFVHFSSLCLFFFQLPGKNITNKKTEKKGIKRETLHNLKKNDCPNVNEKSIRFASQHTILIKR